MPMIDPAINAMLPFARIVSFARGADILCRGELVRWMGLVIRGQLHQCLSHGSRYLVVGALGAGDLIGCEGLFCVGMAASLTIRSTMRTEIATIDHLHLDHILATHLAAERMGIMRSAGVAVASELALVAEALKAMAFETVEQRILGVLRNPARWGLAQADTDGYIEAPRVVMGRILGTSREVVTRALSKLDAEGRVDVRGSEVKVRSDPSTRY